MPKITTDYSTIILGGIIMIKAKNLTKKVDLMLLIFGKEAKVKEVIQTIQNRDLRSYKNER